MTKPEEAGSRFRFLTNQTATPTTESIINPSNAATEAVAPFAIPLFLEELSLSPIRPLLVKLDELGRPRSDGEGTDKGNGETVLGARGCDGRE